MQNIKAGREGKNIMPSKADQRDYMKKIRAAADAGDVNAMVGILIITNQEALSKEIKEHIDSGIINLPGHGGWCGELGDPKQSILEEIRKQNPKSKQLPENK
ncbi:MAG: hypothetical protein H9917_07610 [Candidatus Oceanisphaera merdipullorum]|nr:hypothetical protein [Candidatus Oceanisphaera merdipullorum]